MRIQARAASVAAVLAAGAVALGSGALAAPPHPSQPAGSTPSASPAQAYRPTRHRAAARIDHLFVIMLENHSKSSVIGDRNAPYLTRLAHDYVMASTYYGVTHPSMPNYIASIAGDNFGIQDDNDQNVVNLDRRNLADQFAAHGVRWGAYLEDLPANKLDRFGPTLADGTVVQLYAKKHNPFVLFDSVKNNPARMAHVKDYSSLAADLASKKAPQFVWISPNQCNDMHGGVFTAVAGHPETPCPYGSTVDDVNDAALKAKADTFVKHAVNTIRDSKAWTRRSAIVIVTDESDFDATQPENGSWSDVSGCCNSPYVPKADPRVSLDWPGGTYGGGLIPAIIVKGSGARGVVDPTPYNHYSLLTSIEDNWHLGHLGHAGDRAGGVVPIKALSHRG